MRPHQWVKNAFVVAPLVFSENAGDVTQLSLAALAFALFSVLSGCVYILNDLVDAEADRAHPVKKHRPIASGFLSVPVARASLIGLLLSALAIAALVSPIFAAIGAGYFAMNVAYSFRLKHVPFVDVGLIATGFILRILGGAVAIGVPVSPWLFACTFLLAVFLGLGKRKHELLLVSEGGHTKQRRVLQDYDVEHVRIAMQISGLLTLVSYVMYTVVGTTVSSFSPRDLVWTIPFVGLGLFRFLMLTNHATDARSPTDMMLRDPPFLLNVLAWGIVVVVVIYLP